MIIAMPMAGLGNRFHQSNNKYKKPKPLVQVKGQPMIKKVIDNLRPKDNCKFVFMINKEMDVDWNLANKLKSWQPNSNIIRIEGITEGAVSTAITGAKYINTDEDLLVTACDQLVDIDMDVFYNWCRESEADGVILTYKHTHSNHSYAEVKDNLVTRTAEKIVISDNAAIGIYWFRHGTDFINACCEKVGRGKKDINNEYYVCPLYNNLISWGKKVMVYEVPVDKAHLLGTPELLDDYTKTMFSDS